MIEQRGMFNHLLSKIADLELSASDVVAQTSPQSFVISVWQFLAAPDGRRARPHLCRRRGAGPGAAHAGDIARGDNRSADRAVATARNPPAVPDEPAFRALGRLRALISTGESLAPDLCRDWFRHFPAVPMINAYGATETSDDVATHRLTSPPASTATVPIGRAIANTRLYVLDSHLQPVPIGVAGELYVGGIGVGRGYLNDPEQTRRRFLRDPFSKRAGRAPVPDRRSGALACRPHVGVPRPCRPSGEDPRLQGRARGNRACSGGTPGGPIRRRGGARRQMARRN